MEKALALMEYLKIPTAMVATDKMVKTAAVTILHAATVCPGKYIVLIKGSLGAVKAAVEAGTQGFESNLIDSFILGNPTDQIYGAIAGTTKVDAKGALGIIESYSAASIVEAGDAAAKCSDVQLLEMRLARGMCGKSMVIICGDVSAVEMAVEVAVKQLKEKAMLLDAAVIPSPDEKFLESIY